MTRFWDKDKQYQDEENNEIEQKLNLDNFYRIRLTIRIYAFVKRDFLVDMNKELENSDFQTRFVKILVVECLVDVEESSYYKIIFLKKMQTFFKNCFTTIFFMLLLKD